MNTGQKSAVRNVLHASSPTVLFVPIASSLRKTSHHNAHCVGGSQQSVLHAPGECDLSTVTADYESPLVIPCKAWCISMLHDEAEKSVALYNDYPLCNTLFCD